MATKNKPGTHHQVMHFLAELRAAVPDAVRLFTTGRCFRLYLILRAAWPDAEPWYDSNHVITRIGDRWYDITADVPGDKHLPMATEPRWQTEAFTWAAQQNAADLAGTCMGERK